MLRVSLALAVLASRAFAAPVAPGAAPTTESKPHPRVALLEPAAAGPERDALMMEAPRAPGLGHHAVYLELFGKAGLWGAGYDWQFHPRFAVGAAASYYSFDGDRVTTAAPYVAAYPLGTGHHRSFVQLGPTVVRRHTPSPVPEWDGLTTTKLDAELCAGYEYRNRMLVRVYAMVSAGDHVAPWLGASFGWAL